MVDALTSPILRFYMASLQVEGTSATDLGRGLLERSLSALGAQAPLGSSSSAAAGVGVWGRTGGGSRPRCSVVCTRQMFAAGGPVPRFKAPRRPRVLPAGAWGGSGRSGTAAAFRSRCGCKETPRGAFKSRDQQRDLKKQNNCEEHVFANNIGNSGSDTR